MIRGHRHVRLAVLYALRLHRSFIGAREALHLRTCGFVLPEHWRESMERGVHATGDGLG